MDKSNAAVIPPRRPWYRLHLSTWLTLPFGLVVAVLVVLPGEVGRYPQQPSWVVAAPGSGISSWDGYPAIVHGWPLPYLWRTPKGWAGDSTDATPAAPWQLGDAVHEIRLAALLFDIAATTTCLIGFIALVEWRRRRRRRVLQFTLAEMLVAAGLVSIALGWWSHERAFDREARVRSDRLGKVNSLQSGGMVPRLPLWVRMLSGDSRLAPLGLSRPTPSIDLAWGPESREEIQSLVDFFPHEIIVQAGDAIGDANGEGVAGIRRLEGIECGFLQPGDLTSFLASLGRHPHLRRLKIWNGPLDSGQIAQLATIPQLESLTIHYDYEARLQSTVGALKGCPNLKALEFDGAGFAADGIDSLGELTQLIRLNLNGSQWPVGSASPLARLTGLEELSLSRTNLSDAEALRLRAIPHLRRLSIAHTQMTAEGLRRLLDPSGGPFAGNLEQICLGPDMIDDGLIEALRKLPRLYLICVTWESDLSFGSQRVEPNYWPAVLKLRKTLPDRDVFDLQIVNGSL